MTETVPIGEVRPTTLYLDAGELAAVIETFDFDEPAYDPASGFRMDGELYLQDGHARAFTAYLAGFDELRVDTDVELGTTERRLYRERIEWCREEDVGTIGDLAGRVVNTETYVETWVERCLRAAQRITDERA